MKRGTGKEGRGCEVTLKNMLGSRSLTSTLRGERCLLRASKRTTQCSGRSFMSTGKSPLLAAMVRRLSAWKG